MDSAFEVHRLNRQGLVKAEMIGATFNNALIFLRTLCGEEVEGSREFSIVKTKLEEACFYAKKCMAKKYENQEGMNQGETRTPINNGDMGRVVDNLRKR